MRTTESGGNQYAVGVGAGTRTALDAFSFHAWSFDEAFGATSFADSASGAQSAALDIVSGAIRAGQMGPLQPLPALPNGGSVLHGLITEIRTTSTGATQNPSTSLLSVHGWYKPFSGQTAVGGYGRLLTKWFSTTFATGYDAFGLVLNTNATTSNGSGPEVFLQGHFGVAGVLAAGCTSGTLGFQLPLNQWTHIGATFNAGALALYFNGNIVAQDTAGQATIDFNGASGGAWSTGAVDAADFAPRGSVSDWHVDSGVARSHQYFRDLYRRQQGFYVA